ncbi:MAG TPA: YtxH domain-containing protein [Anaerolineaceae bacterium]
MRRPLIFLLGAVAGGLVGATLALLFAPYSGNKLRDQIQDTYINLRNDVETAAKERRLDLERQLAHLRGEVITDQAE